MVIVYLWKKATRRPSCLFVICQKLTETAKYLSASQLKCWHFLSMQCAGVDVVSRALDSQSRGLDFQLFHFRVTTLVT